MSNNPYSFIARKKAMAIFSLVSTFVRRIRFVNSSAIAKNDCSSFMGIYKPLKATSHKVENFKISSQNCDYATKII